ncbi:hypothetical protein RI367_000804 [Sorochytrium milnesiophthora]
MRPTPEIVQRLVNESPFVFTHMDKIDQLFRTKLRQTPEPALGLGWLTRNVADLGRAGIIVFRTDNKSLLASVDKLNVAFQFTQRPAESLLMFLCPEGEYLVDDIHDMYCEAYPEPTLASKSAFRQWVTNYLPTFWEMPASGRRIIVHAPINSLHNAWVYADKHMLSSKVDWDLLRDDASSRADQAENISEIVRRSPHVFLTEDHVKTLYAIVWNRKATVDIRATLQSLTSKGELSTYRFEKGSRAFRLYTTVKKMNTIRQETPYSLRKKLWILLPPGTYPHWLVIEAFTRAYARHIGDLYPHSHKGKMPEMIILRDLNVPNTVVTMSDSQYLVQDGNWLPTRAWPSWLATTDAQRPLIPPSATSIVGGDRLIHRPSSRESVHDHRHYGSHRGSPSDDTRSSTPAPRASPDRYGRSTADSPFARKRSINSGPAEAEDDHYKRSRYSPDNAGDLRSTLNAGSTSSPSGTATGVDTQQQTFAANFLQASAAAAAQLQPNPLVSPASAVSAALMMAPQNTLPAGLIPENGFGMTQFAQSPALGDILASSMSGISSQNQALALANAQALARSFAQLQGQTHVPSPLPQSPVPTATPAAPAPLQPSPSRSVHVSTLPLAQDATPPVSPDQPPLAVQNDRATPMVVEEHQAAPADNAAAELSAPSPDAPAASAEATLSAPPVAPQTVPQDPTPLPAGMPPLNSLPPPNALQLLLQQMPQAPVQPQAAAADSAALLGLGSGGADLTSMLSLLGGPLAGGLLGGGLQPTVANPAPALGLLSILQRLILSQLLSPLSGIQSLLPLLGLGAADPALQQQQQQQQLQQLQLLQQLQQLQQMQQLQHLQQQLQQAPELQQTPASQTQLGQQHQQQDQGEERRKRELQEEEERRRQEAQEQRRKNEAEAEKEQEKRRQEEMRRKKAEEEAEAERRRKQDEEEAEQRRKKLEEEEEQRRKEAQEQERRRKEAEEQERRRKEVEEEEEKQRRRKREQEEEEQRRRKQKEKEEEEKKEQLRRQKEEEEEQRRLEQERQAQERQAQDLQRRQQLLQEQLLQLQDTRNSETVSALLALLGGSANAEAVLSQLSLPLSSSNSNNSNSNTSNDTNGNSSSRDGANDAKRNTDRHPVPAKPTIPQASQKAASPQSTRQGKTAAASSGNGTESGSGRSMSGSAQKRSSSPPAPSVKEIKPISPVRPQHAPQPQRPPSDSRQTQQRKQADIGHLAQPEPAQVPHIPMAANIAPVSSFIGANQAARSGGIAQ